LLTQVFQPVVITPAWKLEVGGGWRVRAEFSEAQCYEMLRQVRWPNGVTCPHYGRRRVITHSRSARTPRRRNLCLGCRRTFTDLTGTPFARTNLPLDTWLLCLRLMGRGRTTAEPAKKLGVKWDTTAHMRARLRGASDRARLVQQLCEAAEGATRNNSEPGG